MAGLVLDLGDDAGAWISARSEMPAAVRRPPPRARRRARRSRRPPRCRRCVSPRSFSVNDGRLTFTPGRLMWRREASGPGDEHAAADVGVVFLEHLEADEAVVDQHGVADLDVVDEILVVDVDRADLLARRSRSAPGLTVKSKISPALSSIGASRSPVRISGPLMSIMIATSRPTRRADGADAADDQARPVVLGVRHVEPDDVDARRG